MTIRIPGCLASTLILVWLGKVRGKNNTSLTKLKYKTGGICTNIA